MWILSKHLNKSVLSRAQLESLVLQRTVALQNLSQRLLKVQDEERRRVARDLHDSTGQTLAALKMGIATLEQKLKPMYGRGVVRGCCIGGSGATGNSHHFMPAAPSVAGRGRLQFRCTVVCRRLREAKRD